MAVANTQSCFRFVDSRVNLLQYGHASVYVVPKLLQCGSFCILLISDPDKAHLDFLTPLTARRPRSLVYLHLVVIRDATPSISSTVSTADPLYGGSHVSPEKWLGDVLPTPLLCQKIGIQSLPTILF